MKNVFNIADNHIFLSSSIDIIEISKPLLSYGINYFSYTRSYINGERIYLNTHSRMLENYIKNKWFLVGNSEGNPNQYKSQIVFWSTLPNQKIYDNNVRAFGIDHGIFIIEPKIDYCDFYGFATNKENYYVNNIYLNKIEQLKKYILHFNDKASDILKKAESSRIVLPFNHEKLTFIDNKNDNDFENMISVKSEKMYKLSKRQIECAKLIINGKTIKQIAEHTNLSHRTIEDYVNTMKKKLNCRNKYELIIKLMDN